MKTIFIFIFVGNHAMFWPHSRSYDLNLVASKKKQKTKKKPENMATYCLNMAISEHFSQKSFFCVRVTLQATG